MASSIPKAQVQAMGIVSFSGPRFIGKTTLSSAVAEMLGIRRVDLDDVRLELIGDAGTAISSKGLDRITAQSYRETYSRAANIALGGDPVIVVAPNLIGMHREMLVSTARTAEVPLIAVEYNLANIADVIEFMSGRIRSLTEGGSQVDLSSIVPNLGKIARGYQRYLPIDPERVDFTVYVDPIISVEEQAERTAERLRDAFASVRRDLLGLSSPERVQQ